MIRTIVVYRGVPAGGSLGGLAIFLRGSVANLLLKCGKEECVCEVVNFHWDACACH